MGKRGGRGVDKGRGGEKNGRGVEIKGEGWGKGERGGVGGEG